MIRRVLRVSFIVLGSIIALLVPCYLYFVVPNDRRIEKDAARTEPFEERYELAHDLTKALRGARIATPAFESARAVLAEYPYRQEHPSQHLHPLNLHLSLGWFPLKTAHRDCIFAPAPSAMEFTVTLPERPLLSFEYGIVSRAGKHSGAPVRFSVELLPANTAARTVFTALVQPMPPFPWNAYDGYYKNLYKYLHPKVEDREGRWLSGETDLSAYAGRRVTLRLKTEAAFAGGVYAADPDACKTVTAAAPAVGGGPGTAAPGGMTGLAFWGQPRIFNRAPNVARAPNVVLVVIDSFRGDHLTPGTAPELWKMSSEGVRFTNALANGNMTKLSVYSFLTSRYPFEIPEVSSHYDVTPEGRTTFYDRGLPTMPSVLKARGYRTAAIGSMSLMADGHGLSADLGFDEVVNLEHSGYSPPHVTQEGISWLKRHGKEQFFLLLYYDGPHGPYRPPLRYLREAFKRTGLAGGWRNLLYRGEILYHDDYIGRLRRFLRDSGLDKDTVVIFTSDHGVAFRTETYDWPTRYGAWKKKKVRFHSHGVSVTPDDLTVPLVVTGLPQRGVREGRVELLDLAPTVARLAGAPVPAAFRGRSLLPEIEGKNVPRLFSFHQGWLSYGLYWKDRWLYILNHTPREGFPPETLVPEELYDLGDDPACARSLAFSRRDVLGKTRRIVRALVPAKEEYRLTFAAESGSRARITVMSAGSFAGVRLGDTPLEVKPGPLAIELGAGETLSFSTVPGDARVALSGTLGGKPLSPDRLLCGALALPLLDSPAAGPAERELLAGTPDIRDIELKPALLFGFTRSEASGRSENLGQAGQHLKSMLEQWGYINQ